MELHFGYRRSGLQARLLETPAAQDYVRSRGITATEFVTSFRVGYADGTLAAKLPAEGRRELRRVGVLTGSGRELMRGCVLFSFPSG